ncbi:MAG: hypothetical protein ACRD0U_05200 [Acidimicrobiales bacterium]
MAQVMVFVDEAVRGTLPRVCVKDGVPTADSVIYRQPVGDASGIGVAWLLVFTGPIGWIALAFIAASRSGRGEILTVELPWSQDAFHRVWAAERQRGRGIGYLIVVGTGLLVLAATPLRDAVLAPVALAVLLALLVWSAGVIVAAHGQAREGSISVDLDGSRRWVTLSGVHPDFVVAVEQVAAATRT